MIQDVMETDSAVSARLLRKVCATGGQRVVQKAIDRMLESDGLLDDERNHLFRLRDMLMPREADHEG
jgi:F420-dependent methylenetetrahydromethanopterin dehydrogenase